MRRYRDKGRNDGDRNAPDWRMSRCEAAPRRERSVVTRGSERSFERRTCSNYKTAVRYVSETLRPRKRGTRTPALVRRCLPSDVQTEIAADYFFGNRFEITKSQRPRAVRIVVRRRDELLHFVRIRTVAIVRPRRSFATPVNIPSGGFSFRETARAGRMVIFRTTSSYRRNNFCRRRSCIVS